MTVSVCMGIYNGEKYIEKQLQSILEQTVTIDEVILCDDLSTDSSVLIVQKFIEKYHLETSWKLFINEKNKGYPSNFYYAMGLCSGDIVFLADQDDIWAKDKVEKMSQAFSEKHDAKVVCCKFGLIDSNDEKIRSIMQPVVSKETKRIGRVSIENVFYKCEWPGMVLAYNRDWYEKKSKEIQNELKIPHDFLLCAWAAEEGFFYQIDLELAYHRRHDNNAGEEEHRLKKVLNKNRKLNEIEKYCYILHLFEVESVLKTGHGSKVLTTKLEAMKGRYAALQSGKFSQVVKNAIRNKGQIRFVAMMCDLVIVGKKNIRCK